MTKAAVGEPQGSRDPALFTPPPTTRAGRATADTLVPAAHSVYLAPVTPPPLPPPPASGGAVCSPPICRDPGRGIREGRGGSGRGGSESGVEAGGQFCQAPPVRRGEPRRPFTKARSRVFPTICPRPRFRVERVAQRFSRGVGVDETTALSYSDF